MRSNGLAILLLAVAVLGGCATYAMMPSQLVTTPACRQFYLPTKTVTANPLGSADTTGVLAIEFRPNAVGKTAEYKIERIDGNPQYPAFRIIPQGDAPREFAEPVLLRIHYRACNWTKSSLNAFVVRTDTIPNLPVGGIDWKSSGYVELVLYHFSDYILSAPGFAEME